MKKLVTVCWRVVIEVEIPSQEVEDQLFEFVQDNESAALYNKTIKEAYACIQASDGEITEIWD